MTGGEQERMRYFMNRLVWIVSVFALITFAVSCGKAKEAAVEKAIEQQASVNGENVDVDLNDNSMTIKTADGVTKVNGDQATFESADGTTKIDGDSMTMTSKDGNQTMVSGSGAAIPADFPKDVPVYPGAQVIFAATDKEAHATNVGLQSADKVDKVSEYFSKEAAAQGWKENMVMKQPGEQPMHMFGYEKDNRALMVTITGSAAGSEISLSLEEKPAEVAAEPAAETEAEPAPAEDEVQEQSQ